MGYGLGQAFVGYAGGLQQERARQDMLKQQAIQNEMQRMGIGLQQQQLAQEASLAREQMGLMRSEGEAGRALQREKMSIDEALAYAGLDLEGRRVTMEETINALNADFLSGTMDARKSALSAQAIGAWWDNALKGLDYTKGQIENNVAAGSAGYRIGMAAAQTQGQWLQNMLTGAQGQTLLAALPYMPMKMQADIKETFSRAGINLEQIAASQQERAQSAELFPFRKTVAEEEAKQAKQTTRANIPGAQVDLMGAQGYAARVGADAQARNAKTSADTLTQSIAEYQDALETGDAADYQAEASNVIRAYDIVRRSIADTVNQLADIEQHQMLERSGQLPDVLSDLKHLYDLEEQYRGLVSDLERAKPKPKPKPKQGGRQ